MSNKSEEEMFKEVAKTIKLEDQMKSFRDTTYKKGSLDGAAMFEALSKKKCAYDDESGKTLVLVGDTLVPLDDIFQAVIISTGYNYLDSIRQILDKGNVKPEEYDRIGMLLVTTEYISAAIPESKAADDFIYDVFEYVRSLMKVEDTTMKNLYERQLMTFFAASKANINTTPIEIETKLFGRVKMNNTEYYSTLRHTFIMAMYECEMFDFDTLLDSGIFQDIDDDLLRLSLESKSFTKNDKRTILIFSGRADSLDDALEYWKTRDLKFFLKEIANPDEIATLVLQRKIDQKEMRKIHPSEVLEFDFELLKDVLNSDINTKNTQFLEIRTDRNGVKRPSLAKPYLKRLNVDRFMGLIDIIDELKVNIDMSEDEYLQMISTLSVEDMMVLNSKQLISEVGMIKLLEYASLKEIDEEKYKSVVTGLSSFYNSERLNKMQENGSLSSIFIERLNSLVKELPKEDREKYLDELAQNITDDTFIELMKKDFNIKELPLTIDEDKLTDLIIEEKLTEADALRLFQEGKVDEQAITSILSKTEIISSFEKGEFDYTVLTFLSGRDLIIKEELKKGKMDISQVMELYAQENKSLSGEELSSILEELDLRDVALSEYLPDTISEEKVQALFEDFYISHDEISTLVARGIITQEQADSYAEALASHKVYEEIFSNEDLNVFLTSETAKGFGRTMGLPGGGYSSGREKTLKIDPDLKEQLMEDLGFDQRRLHLSGTYNSLDGYEVYPSEELGLMVFINPDKPGNASYIMSLQQGMFWLKKIARTKALAEKNQGQIQSSATKQEIRETEHVRVRNDAKAWGKNMVQSMKELSPTLREKLKDDKQYEDKVNDIIDLIKEDYELRK